MPGRSRLVGGEGVGWGEWEEENGREREGRGGGRLSLKPHPQILKLCEDIH